MTLSWFISPQVGPIRLNWGKDFYSRSGREDFFLLLDLNIETCAPVGVGHHLVSMKEASLRTKPSHGGRQSREAERTPSMDL